MGDADHPFEGIDDLVSSWLKTTGDYWNTMFQTWADMGQNGQFQSAAARGSPDGPTRASVTAAIKSFQAFTAAISEPQVAESLLKGVGAMPEILSKIAQSSLNGFLQMQQKWVERAGRIGKATEAYQFQDLDENTFRAWADIYEKEFKQFLNIPQLGLTRFYQEKINRLTDAFNRFQTTLSEFLRLLYLPVGKSFTVLQETLGEMAENGTLPEDANTYYQMWVKVLEGHYMTLFQSPEYVEMLGKTIEDLTAFSKAKDDVAEDFLNLFPVPKQKDMDALYQEIYLLKKRIRDLEKQTR